MNWLDPFRSLWSRDLPQCRLSRQLLRYVFAPRDVELGGSVLCVGHGADEWARLARFLGFEAAGIEAASFDEAQTAMELPPQRFHFVLACGLSEHRLDLGSHRALAASAELAALIRPGGRFMALARFDPTWEDSPGGHLRSCHARHLAPFPGQAEICCFPDGVNDRRTWRWMLGRQPRSGFLTSTLRLPEMAMPRTRWRTLAAQASRHVQAPCCLWSGRAASLPPAAARAA